MICCWILCALHGAKVVLAGVSAEADRASSSSYTGLFHLHILAAALPCRQAFALGWRLGLPLGLSKPGALFAASVHFCFQYKGLHVLRTLTG